LYNITAEESKYGVWAEVDGLLEFGSWPPRNPKINEHQLRDPYFCVLDCAGFLFGREISRTTKTFDDLNKKLIALLPEGYRPLHVLRMFAGFDILCERLPGDVQTAEDLGRGCLKFHIPLAVLTFSGRVSSTHVDDFLAQFPNQAWINKHTKTLRESEEAAQRSEEALAVSQNLVRSLENQLAAARKQEEPGEQAQEQGPAKRQKYSSSSSDGARRLSDLMSKQT
jgi:hypothetical protein